MLYKRKLRWRSDDVNHNSFVTLVSIRLPLPCCKLCKLSISLGSFFSKNRTIFIHFLYAQNVVLVANFEFAGFRKQKNTRPLTVSMETVRMAKSYPRKNQSERSDLPCHIIKKC